MHASLTRLAILPPPFKKYFFHEKGSSHNWENKAKLKFGHPC